jgi:hypothetical protein
MSEIYMSLSDTACVFGMHSIMVSQLSRKKTYQLTVIATCVLVTHRLPLFHQPAKVT